MELREWRPAAAAEVSQALVSVSPACVQHCQPRCTADKAIYDSMHCLERASKLVSNIFGTSKSSWIADVFTLEQKVAHDDKLVGARPIIGSDAPASYAASLT